MNKISITAWFMALWTGLQCFSVSAADNTKEMKAVYDRGVSLYEQKKYAEAGHAFRELVEGTEDPKYYYNVGECEYLRQRFDLAKEAFEIFLARAGDAVNKERRAYAEEVIQKVTPVLGHLKVDDKPDLEVWVDDEHRTSTPTDKPIIVMSGEHIVVLKEDGEPVFEGKIIVEREGVSVVKRTESEPTEDMSSPPSSSEQPSSQPATQGIPNDINEEASKEPIKPVGFGMLGVGVAMLTGGVITGSLALSKEESLKDKCPTKTGCSEQDKKIHDSGRRLATAASVLLPIGGAFAIVGVVLATVGYKRESRQEHKTVSIKIDPLLDSYTAGVAVSGRF